MRILATRSATARLAFKVEVHDSEEALGVRLSDVYPLYAAAFKLRLAAWAGLVVRQFLDALTSQAAGALRQNGY